MNITDAEDALLFGQAEVKEWQDEFMREWFAPIGATVMAMVLQRIPPEVLDQMQQVNPGGQDLLAQIIANGGKYA